MRCSALHKWIWRQGAEALPVPLEEHVALCSRCRALVESVSQLDHAITADTDDDPGAPYWETLPVHVQQRLGEGQQVTIAVLGSLDRRRRKVVALRCGFSDGQGMSFEEIGQAIGVSRTRAG